MNVAVTLTSKDVFNENLNLADCKLLLGSLDQTDVLRVCALLNAINQISAYEVRGWKSESGEKLLEQVLKDLLEPICLGRAMKLYRTSQRFAPFNGAGISGVIGLACRWCPKEGGHKLNSIEHGQRVARVLFALQGAMMNKAEVKKTSLQLESQRALFPHLVRNILANQIIRMEHDLGRLHAFASQPEVAEPLGRELQVEKPIDKWFADTFGLSVLDYQCILTALGGYAGSFIRDNHVAHLHLRLDAFLNLLNRPRECVEELLRLAVTTPEQVVSAIREPKELADAVLSIDHLVVYPLLQIDDFYLVTSFEAVFGKFIRGLPYLSSLMAERKKASGSDTVLKGARSGFGHIFEGYAGWLAHQWFGGSNIRIIQDYRVQLPSHRKGDSAQRDLLLIRDDVGYAIETKAKVPTLELRRTGDLEELVRMVVPKKDDDKGLVFQACTAAEALVAGKAFLSDKKTPIPPLRRVFPIGLVFEQLPLRFCNSKPFEVDVVKAYGSDVFRDSGKIAPLQFFDIQSFEEWDVVFDMPSEAALLLMALEKRAYKEILRYEDMESIRGHRRANWRAKPGLLDRLANASEEFAKANCQFLKLANTSQA